jgi:hypothetical protein
MIRWFSLAVLLLVGAVGCATSSEKLAYNVTAPNTLETFKRQSTHGMLDNWLNFYSRTAYSEVKGPITRHLTADKEAVITRHGQPDFVRNGFRAAMTGELVDEWLYWDRQIVVQFVGGRLAYEGPLTEMDAFRVRYGYPDEIYWQPATDPVGLRSERVQSMKPFEGARGHGVNRQIWVYTSWLYGRERMIATFSSEELTSLQTY